MKIIKSLLAKIGLQAIEGTYIENGLIFGITWEYFDEMGEEDRHLSLWLGVLVFTLHFR